MQSINSIGYKIQTGHLSLKELERFVKKGNYSRYFIFCDEHTMEHCLPILVNACHTLKDAEIFEIESGEKSKNLILCSQIWQTLIEYKADKNALIINLGGGVISDFGGFVASVYKRGVDFVNVPTSLLAMADASVGGKTGIDFAEVKNSLGTITQPKGVFIFYDYLKTLPREHVYNGLAEVYKIALISDKIFWKKLAGVIRESDRDGIIYKSIQLKNAIVRKDPYEKKERKALNFGHTIGHALEGALLGTEHQLMHGQAVIVGMICEAWLSFQKKLLSAKDFTHVAETLFSIFAPKAIPVKYFDKIHSLMLNDKKNKKQQLLFSLMHGIGKSKLDVVVTEEQVKKALLFYNAFVK